MPSASIEEALAEAQPPSPDELTPSTIVAILREHLAAHPESIEELAPGMKLVPRPLTPKERARSAVPAMNAARRRYHDERLKIVGDIIRRLVRENPAISKGEIAAVLRKTDHTPSTKRTQWRASDVARIIKECGIVHHQSPSS